MAIPQLVANFIAERISETNYTKASDLRLFCLNENNCYFYTIEIQNNVKTAFAMFLTFYWLAIVLVPSPRLNVVKKCAGATVSSIGGNKLSEY